MRLMTMLAAAAFVTACGQPAATGQADAQPQAAAAPAAAGPATGAITDADRTAILGLMNARADAHGMVDNDCGEKVTPRLLPADMGGGGGAAVLLVMEGGPNTAACYGDGPGLTLMMRDGASWRMVYSSRGGYMAILPTQHGGVHDVAFAGPGFEHPLFTWNGAEFAPANRMIADAQMESATILPN